MVPQLHDTDLSYPALRADVGIGANAFPVAVEFIILETASRGPDQSCMGSLAQASQRRLGNLGPCRPTLYESLVGEHLAELSCSGICDDQIKERLAVKLAQSPNFGGHPGLLDAVQLVGFEPAPQIFLR
ncbi:hypothetical protein C1A38_00560 [Verrucosispora sp. ts21]|nr:hypothetical protein C1A38_00560 [Verrucosispora sp. ts21]